MERIVHKSRDFQEAARWNIEQQIGMTPQERMRVSRVLKERVYRLDAKDVRQCHGK